MERAGRRQVMPERIGKRDRRNGRGNRWQGSDAAGNNPRPRPTKPTNPTNLCSLPRTDGARLYTDNGVAQRLFTLAPELGRAKRTTRAQ